MAEIIDTAAEPDRALSRGVEVLSSGRPVAIPTETVYGLAADATRAEAVLSIYETKGRPRFNPLIAHVGDMAMAERHAVFDPISRRLAERFWPGPLTLVLPLRRDPGDGVAIDPLASAGLDTIGLRMPDGFARRLISAFGRPLAAPSANTSGRISPTMATHVAEDLGEKIALILDGGPCPVGVESTIVKVDGKTLTLLRPGGLDAAEIERVSGHALTRLETPGATILAPGMLASHYAPDALVRLDVTQVRPGEALIRFGSAPVPGEEQAAIVIELSRTGDLRTAAARLFSALKEADRQAHAGIAVTPIPGDGLGEAIRDRLMRAAAPRG
ncbi:threonylcarbamoyl-AMP synthase [Xaviernesmea oryzae]|uniref:Threonylcarbamoyl-AMP synthase n=1 Tax=Xaviernesmea oryzae TaxID=464029 RepID=A0A1Q9ATD4_9HYPH|nr:L-threonylcarbamoyladenylate synthase [Xaviernesmea oryzae]OLP58702.1 threonylcarbamoyl-AMP synthase [Xaviernesmea oryzae]SEK68906.1 L-threonylcarbamoyladenylate synthase [Xaviernesmea oryzae]